MTANESGEARTRIHVLMLEDNPNDAALMDVELRRGGFDPICERVDTEPAFLAALDRNVDLILADYALPSFSAPRALDLLIARGLDVPFIVVCSIADDAAIDCLRTGATDYLLKDRLARLPSAAAQALTARALRGERRKADERLAFQAHLLDVVDHAVIATDLDGRVTYWNRAAERLYGWTAREAVGSDIATLTIARTATAKAQEIMARLTEGLSWSGEFLVRRKDGTTFPAHVADSPVRNDRGQMTGMIGISYDITERKRAEEEIVGLARFPGENPNPVLRLGPDGAVLFGNRASAPVLASWGSQIGALIPDPLRGVVNDVYRAGERREMDLESDARTYASEFVPIPGAPYVNLYLRDVTDRRLFEVALRESEERLRLVTDNVLDMVSHVGLDGTFLWASPSHEVVLGYSPQTLVGSSAFSLVHPEDVARVRPAVDAAVRECRSERFEFRCRHAGGHYIQIEAVGRLLLDSAGTPVGAVLSSRDITGGKLLEEDLRRQAAELERFNRLAVGRELRMIELKRQINRLSRQLGRPEPFRIRPDADVAASEAR
jgi:PAS domain S-box-containing protein